MIIRYSAEAEQSRNIELTKNSNVNFVYLLSASVLMNKRVRSERRDFSVFTNCMLRVHVVYFVRRTRCFRRLVIIMYSYSLLSQLYSVCVCLISNK